MAILDGEECDWCDQRAIDMCCGESLCAPCLIEHDEENECPGCGAEYGLNFRTCEVCAEEHT